MSLSNTHDTQIAIGRPYPGNTPTQIMDLGPNAIINGGTAAVSANSITNQTGAAIILPTADPHVKGAIWWNTNTVSISVQGT